MDFLVCGEGNDITFTEVQTLSTYYKQNNTYFAARFIR